MESFDEECKYALFADILDLEADDRFNFISIMLNKKGFIVKNCLLCNNTQYNGLLKKEFCCIYGGEKNACYKNKKYEVCPYFKYASQREGRSEFRKYDEILFWEKSSIPNS